MTKAMSRLVGLVLLLLPLSTQAHHADVPLFSGASRISILYPMPDVMYAYDQHGNSIILYRQWFGLVWYSARDSFGRIVKEGYGVVPPLVLDPGGRPSVNGDMPDRDLR